MTNSSEKYNCQLTYKFQSFHVIERCMKSPRKYITSRPCKNHYHNLAGNCFSRQAFIVENLKQFGSFPLASQFSFS